MDKFDDKKERFEVGQQQMLTPKEKFLRRKKESESGKTRYIAAAFILIGIIGFTYFSFYYKSESKSVIKNEEPFLGGGDASVPVLLSDIGGTNCRLRILQIYPDPKKDPKEISADVLKSWEYPSIEDLLNKFLKPFVGTPNYPKYAVLGIPGAIQDNTMMPLVNIPQWKQTNGDELAKKIGLKKLFFVNDFVINGYGIQSEQLKEGKDYILVNNKKPNNKDKKFVIGPGTGLGVCYLIKNPGDKYYNVYGSEGSHQDFAPKDFRQFKYLKFLESYFSLNYVSAESACAGPSLIPLYKYLSPILQSEEGVKCNKDLFNEISPVDKNTDPNILNKINREIVSKGVSGECQCAKGVLEYFVDLLGNITGNMSIYTLPYGGIYIVGGLSASIKEIYKTGIFQNALLKRGEQNNLLKDIPIVLILNENIGMIGAIEVARRMVSEGM
ncbi:MAG: glucokinase [archaeon]|nr:glucokinase [archaeon]